MEDCSGLPKRAQSEPAGPFSRLVLTSPITSPQVRVALHKVRNALDVVRHREQVEGAQRRPARSRARRRTPRRAPAPPGRRRRRRPPAGPARRSAATTSPLGARSAAGRGRRGRRGPIDAAASARSTRSGRPARPGAGRRGSPPRVVDGGAVGLDGDDVTGQPDAPRPGTARTARRRRRGRATRSPGCGSSPVEHRGDQRVGGAGVHLPEAGAGHLPAAAGGLLGEHLRPVGVRRPVGRRDQPQLLAGRGDDRLDPGGVGPLGVGHSGRPGCAIRQSSTGTTSWERCLRRPGAADGRDRPLHPGAPAAARRRRRSRPTASTVTSTSSPASRDSCSRTTAALSARWAGRATCWKSQPPQASGPGERAGRRDPVGGGLEHLDGVGAQEPVALAALGDLDDDPLPGQRVPHEDHDGPLGGRATTQCPPCATGPTLDLEPLPDPGPAAGLRRAGTAAPPGSTHVPVAVLRPGRRRRPRRGARRRRAPGRAPASPRSLGDLRGAQLVGHRGDHHARA